MDEPDEIAQAVGEAERASSEGDHARAEQALRRALWMQEARFGVVHPEVANTLNNLGVVCDILGRPDEAEFLYRRALGLARTTLPAEHPYIATSLENLSALYKTQGRPEKLALVADSEISRSGLPIRESADAAGVEGEASEAEVSEGEARAQTPASASPAGSRAPSPPQTTPDTIDNQRGLPVVQMLATASIVLLVGWWLFGGNGEQEVTGLDRDALVTPATPPPVSVRRDGAADPPAEPASEPESAPESEPASAPESAPASTPESTPESTPASTPELTPESTPEDNASQVAPESQPDPPPPAPADETDVASPVVVEAQVCSSLVTRDNDGDRLRDWRCDEVVDSAEPGQLYFYTRIRSPTSLTVEHRWLRNGVVEQTIDLDVTVNNGLGYRTYSSIAVPPAMSGAWRVELRTGNQAVLRVEEFVVLP